VPVVKHVKSECGKIIDAYEACVQANAKEPHLCVDALRELNDCTDRASQAFLNKRP
jgi:hypothetical protein